MQCVFQITASSLRSDAAIDLLMHLVSQVDPFCIQWVFTDVWYLFFYKIMNMAFWTSYQHFQGVKSTTVCPNHELAKTWCYIVFLKMTLSPACCKHAWKPLPGAELQVPPQHLQSDGQLRKRPRGRGSRRLAAPHPAAEAHHQHVQGREYNQGADHRPQGGLLQGPRGDWLRDLLQGQTGFSCTD